MAKKRSRTRQARQRRQQQRRKSKRFALLGLIALAAVVAVAVIVVSNQPVESFVAADLSGRYAGVTRSFSIEGYPQLGELDAPVTVDEYASFSCPGCQALHADAFDALLDRVRQDQILLTYVPLQTGSIPNAQGAARAALCAGRQGKFWEMHDVLFDWQTRYGNTAFSQNRLLAGADKLDLNKASFTNCFNSAEISATLNAALGENVGTTPTINVNGVTIAGASGLPSEAEILRAIDDATPDDWGMPPVVESEAEAAPAADSETAPESEPEVVTGEGTDAPPAEADDESAQEEGALPATDLPPTASPADDPTPTAETLDEAPAAAEDSEAESDA